MLSGSAVSQELEQELVTPGLWLKQNSAGEGRHQSLRPAAQRLLQPPQPPCT